MLGVSAQRGINCHPQKPSPLFIAWLIFEGIYPSVCSLVIPNPISSGMHYNYFCIYFMHFFLFLVYIIYVSVQLHGRPAPTLPASLHVQVPIQSSSARGWWDFIQLGHLIQRYLFGFYSRHAGQFLNTLLQVGILTNCLKCVNCQALQKSAML